MGVYVQDCSQCTDSRLRKDWGCDQPTPHEIDRYPCPCSGLDSGCNRCSGSGMATLHTCPNRIVDRQTMAVIRYVGLAKEGTWPVAGGSLDQSQSFLDAFAVVTSEIARIENSNGSE